MDGIDVAAIVTDGESFLERGPSHFVAYEPEFRQQIIAALDVARMIERRADRPGTLGEIEREITLRHVVAVKAFLSSAPDAWKEIDLIGFHGQTVMHRPEKALTVQLGDGQLLARETGIDVVGDMRAQDMVAGGQGAPLAPAYHAALAHALREHRAVGFPVVFVNIGGISNVTYIPEQGDPVAFDSGPGNNLIDQWVKRQAGVEYDDGGTIAAGGKVLQAIVERYLTKPFFGQTGPKSLDRSDFTLEHLEGVALTDGARTLAALAAQAILKSANHMPETPKLWILCGGGRKNPHIVADMRAGAASQGAEVIVADEAGFDGDSVEAEAWAYLAVRSVKGLPLTYPTTTGCRQAITGGVLFKG